MRHVFVLALLAAPLAGLPARAQYGYAPAGVPGNGVALVTNWIQQYLHRPPNSFDLANGQSIDAGTADPVQILAGILGVDEYYNQIAHGTDRGWIDQVFTDITGRPPSPGEEAYWYNRLIHGRDDFEGRKALAYALLQRYPPNLSAVAAPAPTYQEDVVPVPPPEPTYEYRRPYYRVWREHDWHDRDRHDRDWHDRDRHDRDYHRPDYRGRDRDRHHD